MTPEELAALIETLGEMDKKFSTLLYTIEQMCDQAPRNINARRTANYMTSMIWNLRWALFHALAIQATALQEAQCQTNPSK